MVDPSHTDGDGRRVGSQGESNNERAIDELQCEEIDIGTWVVEQSSVSGRSSKLEGQIGLSASGILRRDVRILVHPSRGPHQRKRRISPRGKAKSLLLGPRVVQAQQRNDGKKCKRGWPSHLHELEAK